MTRLFFALYGGVSLLAILFLDRLVFEGKYEGMIQIIYTLLALAFILWKGLDKQFWKMVLEATVKLIIFGGLSLFFLLDEGPLYRMEYYTYMVFFFLIVCINYWYNRSELAAIAKRKPIQ